MELEDIHGIGPTIARRLGEAGIGSIAELARTDPRALQSALGDLRGMSPTRASAWIADAAQHPGAAALTDDPDDPSLEFHERPFEHVEHDLPAHDDVIPDELWEPNGVGVQSMIIDLGPRPGPAHVPVRVAVDCAEIFIKHTIVYSATCLAREFGSRSIRALARDTGRLTPATALIVDFGRLAVPAGAHRLFADIRLGPEDDLIVAGDSAAS
jgi:hypothetical protein